MMERIAPNMIPVYIILALCLVWVFEVAACVVMYRAAVKANEEAVANVKICNETLELAGEQRREALIMYNGTIRAIEEADPVLLRIALSPLFETQEDGV